MIPLLPLAFIGESGWLQRNINNSLHPTCMKPLRILALLIVALSFILSFYYYDIVPEKYASHWGMNGEVNGYIGKGIGLFLIPIIMTLIFAFFIAIPKIDPLKGNIEKFMKEYDRFLLLAVGFMFFIHLQSLLWNLGILISPNATYPAAIGILFLYMGFILPKMERNWFIGIRTPWTISDEKVWQKTHVLGGKLFMASGIISIFGIFFNQLAFNFILVPVILSTVFLLIYSF